RESGLFVPQLKEKTTITVIKQIIEPKTGVRLDVLVERGPRLIQAESFYSDNLSARAAANRTAYEDAYEAKTLKVVKGCGDSRVKIPTISSQSYRQLGAGGEVEPLKEVLNDEHVDGIVHSSHGGGSTLIKDGYLYKCGAGFELEKLHVEDQKAKAGEPVEKTDTVKGPARVVAQTIEHWDPTLDAYLSTETLVDLTPKPLLGTVQDHETLRLYPVILFANGKKYTQVSNEDHFRARKKFDFDREEFYARHNGVVPTIDMGLIKEHAPQFVTMIKQHNAEVDNLLIKMGREVFSNATEDNKLQIKAAYSDENEYLKVIGAEVLKLISQVQTPKTVIGTTDPRRIDCLCPEIAQIPGSVFRITGARFINHAGKLLPQNIVDLRIASMLDGIEYALAEAIKHRKMPDQAFYGTSNVLLTARTTEGLELLTQAALHRKTFQEFLEMDYTQLLGVVVHDGVMQGVPRRYSV
ncbi:hypothetical protein HGB07_06830, partial [Candidatus Roizmanbacteria bacterium]|nr:hypothetical protein [Candidatus Roizmanbacteria bacterium]